jgi:hypothetical protein
MTTNFQNGSFPALLHEVVKQSFVLSYKEDALQLVDVLSLEGLNPILLRASYNKEELSYSSNTRTFLSHAAAWKRAALCEGYTLICESDFVPCSGVGFLPVFWPMAEPLAWGYLYQGSPRLLALVKAEGRRFLRGHCAPLVSYVINRPVAKLLLAYFDDEISRHNPHDYFGFDVHLQWWTMARGATAFIPLQHYGEHGGFPNPEHAANKIRRAGRHRADNLARRLSFLPQYARGSKVRYIRVRIGARMLGFARLLSNRWVVETDMYHHRASDKLLMQFLGLRRLLF